MTAAPAAGRATADRGEVSGGLPQCGLACPDAQPRRSGAFPAGL
ncbi:hypothetical protein [Micromonospora echinofusca]|nr:hypothetical protein [Micromonospora echinofusca]